jgi:3-oxoacid CoA-transferase B subunit
MTKNRKQSDCTPEEEAILRRAALEIEDGTLVNLGIGMPTLLPGFLPAGLAVSFHSENGFVGLGPPLRDGTPDNDVVDAGGRATMLMPGAACFDSATSFGIVRGGHLDLAVLGAFQVAVNGDLANWKIPGKLTPGMGGAMELAQKARQVLVISRHFDKHGKVKLLAECSLPLTARGCVDTLITERAVFRRRDARLRLTSVHPGYTAESVLQGIAANIEVDGELEPWKETLV